MEPVRNLDTSHAWGTVTYSGNVVERLERPAATRRGDGDRDGRTPPRAHLRYAPGLDGVRALAVAAVVVYHLGATWLTGGFLGVDVFFTLSGFLITSILLTEFHARGHIDIRTFYLRRARRLLPALFLMLATTTLVAAVVARTELHRLRGDVLAALTYCTNWTQIAWNRSYFAQLGRPSLLQHLWSLAVEEQFYLLWPLVLVACLAARRRSTPLAVAVGSAGASLLLMALLFHGGIDPARVYYGTDTHISPMLIGAALAIVVAFREQAGRTGDSSGARAALDGGAVLAIAGLAWAAVSIDYYSAALYRGGYLLVGLAAGALIVAAARPDTLTAALLSRRPLVWIGQRSYAIYLWHWPVLMLTRPKIDVPLHGPVLIALQVGVIVLIADLSYRYVERPIRSAGLGGTLRTLRQRSRRSSTRAVPAIFGARPGTVLVAVGAGVAALLLTAPSTSGIEVDHSKQLSIHVHSPARQTFARPVRVSFFGDSQGMTLLINKPNGLAGSITTSNSTVEGCGVLLGTIHSRVGYTRNLTADCGNWPALWARHVAANRPQIAAIEIGAWDVFDDTVGGHALTFGSTAWDAYFTRQLAKGIAILTKAGAQVALIGVPCYRPIAAGGLPLLPERGQDTRTRHVTGLLAAAARTDPQRVFMVNPPSQFCRNPIARDVNYRWDGTHFYKPGAALMFQVITPQLLAIPRPPH